MIDFWTRQDRARRSSRWLIALLLVLVVTMVVVIDATVWWLLNLGQARPDHLLRLLAWTTVGTLALILGGAAWRFWQLRRGGVDLALHLGGAELFRDHATPAQRRVLDVVEEMAIASGLPVPPVYLLPEDGINACAAGYSPDDAVVCLTRGAVEHLSRDELQGVVAHEFAHILNGDMALNLRTLCLVHGLLAVHLAGRELIDVALRSGNQTSSRRKRGGIELLALGAALWVLGGLGWFGGRLVRAAACRQREMLADASAVQFTRQPAGLAGALLKVLGLSRGSLLTNPATEEAAHLFFAETRKSWLSLGMDTHPPVEARIRLLTPAWDGQVPAVVSWNPSQGRVTMPEPAARPATPAAGLAGVVMAASVAARVGTLPPEAVALGALLLQRLPASLRQAAGEAQGAQAAALAALLPAGHAAWEQVTDPALRHRGETLATALDAAGRAAGRLPVVQLCLPALRRLGHRQAEALATLITTVAAAEVPAAFLARLLLVHLRPAITGPAQFHAITPLRGDVAVILGALVQCGQGDPTAAWAAAWSQVMMPGERPPLPTSTDPSAVLAALERLARANGAIKRRLVSACAHAVAADGRVEPAEAELLRLAADSLGCPLPPFSDQTPSAAA